MISYLHVDAHLFIALHLTRGLFCYYGIHVHADPCIGFEVWNMVASVSDQQGTFSCGHESCHIKNYFTLKQ